MASATSAAHSRLAVARMMMMLMRMETLSVNLRSVTVLCIITTILLVLQGMMWCLVVVVHTVEPAVSLLRYKLCICQVL